MGSSDCRTPPTKSMQPWTKLESCPPPEMHVPPIVDMHGDVRLMSRPALDICMVAMLHEARRCVPGVIFGLHQLPC